MSTSPEHEQNPGNPEDQSVQRIELTTNPYLDMIVQALAKTQVNWEALISRVRGTQRYRGAKVLSFESLQDGFFLEEHVGMVVDIVDEKIGGIDTSAAAPGYYSTEHYTHLTGPDNTSKVVLINNPLHTVAEYDVVCSVQGDNPDGTEDVFAIIEVKGGVQRRQSPIPKSPMEAMSEGHIRRIFDPIVELCEESGDMFIPCRFSYVVVLLPEHKVKQDAIDDFRARGGIVVELPIDRKVFKEECAAARIKLEEGRNLY